MEEFVGSLDGFRTLESRNTVSNDNYMSENNDVFDNITQLVASTSDGNEGPAVGCPIEWGSSFGDERTEGVGGSIAERRAATCGFNGGGGFSGPAINVARFRSVSPLSSPVGRSSSYITIPAGISPTELLDSPVMLQYSQAQPSPTTGSFQLSPLNRESVTLDSFTPATTEQEIENDVGSSIRSRLLETHISCPSVSSMGNKDFQSAVEFPSFVTNSDTELSANFDYSKDTIDHLASQSYSDGDNQGTLSASKTSEDGYNWRKYGQKQVKGSEFPRSYYKCTHPNCLVKKKVERSFDGDVAEIIYKGSHNHPPPQPNPRLMGGSFSDNDGVNESSGGEREGGGIVWRNIQPKKDPNENIDAFSTAQMKSTGVYEVGGSSEPSCKLFCHDEDDGKSLEDDAYLDESELKRRKIDLPFPETNVASRGVREPRVVVQIESEVDILDDGYRWRKYGQKVVKGNPNPRSYYKCTSPGCPVRKHVERACDDYKFVITAYEGKHDHGVPIAKTATMSLTSSSQPNTQLAYANVPKTEPQIRKIPDLGNDFMRSALLGNYGADMYPLRFPHLSNPMGYNYNVGMSNFPMSLLYDVPRPPPMMIPSGVNLYNLAAPVQSTGVGQQPLDNDLGIIKQEKL